MALISLLLDLNSFMCARYGLYLCVLARKLIVMTGGRYFSFGASQTVFLYIYISSLLILYFNRLDCFYIEKLLNSVLTLPKQYNY